MSSCGHRCCEIAENAYHSHAQAPATCPHCAERAASAPAALPRTDLRSRRPTRDEAEVISLGVLVADVVANVAPQIPGLPTGIALADLVSTHARRIHEAALADPALRLLDEADRQLVMAARVGLLLAFPDILLVEGAARP